MKNISQKRLIILVIFFSVGAIECAAQYGRNARTDNQYSYVNMGIGGSSFGISNTLSFTYQWGNNLITARYLGNTENCLFCSASPLLYARDISLLYGISSRKGGWASASISTGLGLVLYNERGKPMQSDGNMIFSNTYYEEIKYTTVGMPIEAQLMLHGKAFGVGLIAFANINTNRPYAGLLFSLQFGLLR